MRAKLLSIFMICLFFFSCGDNKLSDQQITDSIKAKFQLIKNDKIEILGVAEEDENISVVKTKLNNVDFSIRMKKYDKGWQIEEVKNEWGAWISADIVAKIFDHSEKQKIAMIEINTIATVIVAYLTDNGVFPDINGDYNADSKFYKTVVPFYISSLPIKDPWGNNYLIYSKEAANGKYGFKDASNLDCIIVSLGKDGIPEFNQDFVSNPGSGLSSIRSYDIDIVMLNGEWIRAPKKSE